MQLKEHTYFGENNRYYLEKLLGRGGFSEVWLVKDTITGTEDALKVYAPGYGMDNSGLKVFSKELALVHNIHHRNLLTASYVGVWENMPYLIMSYCPNGSLVSKVGKLSEQEAWRLIKEACSGLEYLHNQKNPIVHQDIKPDNILVDALGNYVITDFGISTRSQATLRKSVRDSSTGTTAYMAPERFGTDPLPIMASDVWAFGATLFELIEGYAPFGELGGLSQKSGADIPYIKSEVSPKLREVITAMLAKDPWDRPTVEDLINGKKVAIGIEIERQEIKKEEKTPNPNPKKRVLNLAILICTCCVLLLGWGGYAYHNKKEDDKRSQIELQYETLKQCCNTHFREGDMDAARRDIKSMELMESKYAWIKAYSATYSTVVEEKSKSLQN